jgi:transcription elongation factor Elf1
MKDIFDAKISCKKCDEEMKPILLVKQGFKVRAVRCDKCGEKIVHPADLHHLQHYNDLKRKTYNVKLRVVGNSHAVSIPKEIVDFINDTHRGMSKQMDDMVKLCFEDFGKLSLRFIDEEVYENAKRR